MTARDTGPRGEDAWRGGSRRGFLGAGVVAIAATATGNGEDSAARAVPPGGFHVAGSDEIPLALVGCGSRGGGAVGDAFRASGGRVRLTAMADVQRPRIAFLKRTLEEQFADRVDVPEDRAFVGFDAYRRALDSLPPGGIAILATPPAFRAVHLGHAIDRGLHAFMEKPVSIDGPSTRRMLELAARADAKRLKIAVGLMCRHCERRRELVERLHDGQAGDLISFRGYRSHAPIHDLDLAAGRGDTSELLWQVRRFHNFLWASGGVFADYCIHLVDEVCWAKGAWPVTADGVGGRHFKGRLPDQNFDVYEVEYTFADGATFFFESRLMKHCRQHFGVYGQGSRGAFTISTGGHSPARSTIYRSQRLDRDDVLWTADQPEPNPYQLEWDHFLAAIVADDPYNEAVRGAEASLVTAMGRFSAHVGRPVTFQEMLECPEDLAAGADALASDSPAPAKADADGRYAVPNPGKTRYELGDQA